EAILGLFDQPRTCPEVAALVCEATGLPELGMELFEELVRARIIGPPVMSVARGERRAMRPPVTPRIDTRDPRRSSVGIRDWGLGTGGVEHHLRGYPISHT